MKDNEFGDWLRDELRRRELTQSAFARRARIAPSTVSTWISGDRTPDPTSIDIVADVLLADRDRLLDMVGHRPLDMPRDYDSLPEQICRLVRRVEWNEDREDAVRTILERYAARPLK